MDDIIKKLRDLNLLFIKDYLYLVPSEHIKLRSKEDGQI